MYGMDCAVPTWGIILIVLVVLLVLLCVAYLVRKLLSKKRHKTGKDAKKGMKGAMDVKGVPVLDKGQCWTRTPRRA